MPAPSRPIPPLARFRREPFRAAVPGSKSYTLRALLLAAMRTGTTEVAGGLHCDDTDRLGVALSAFAGLRVERLPTGYRCTREAGQLGAPAGPLDLGDGGAPSRFLLPFAAAAEGATVITGSPRLRERPMADLLATLRALGIRCECLGREGHLPVRVHGGAPPTVRRWQVGAGISSQFTSALLLYASQLPGPAIELELEVGPDEEPASAPYVEMTRAILGRCGIATARNGNTIVVQPAPPVLARIPIETDASSMSYFIGLAALTGTTVEVPGIDQGSLQGDVGFARVLAAMGCEVAWSATGLRLTGGPLRGVDVDLRSMPDVALTLAAVALRAVGPTRIRNVATLRHKESDRIAAAVAELTRLGQRVEAGDDSLTVHPAGSLRPCRIETHGDHRVAMAFAGLGLLQTGIEVADPDCVGKSFPGFWTEFERFCAHHRGEAVQPR